MKPSENKKWTIAEILTNFGQRQAEVQQEKMLKQQLKDALMQNQAQALSQFIPGMQQQMPMNPDDMAFDEYYQQAKRGGIHIDPRKKGTFKAQATRMGMSVQEAASHILANKHRYSPAMVKKANFAKNFAKEEGGEMMACPDGHYWNGRECVPIPNQVSDRNMSVNFTNPPTYTVSGPNNSLIYDGSDNERAKGYYALGERYAIVPPEGMETSRPNPQDLIRQITEQNSDIMRNMQISRQQQQQAASESNWNRIKNSIEKQNDGGQMMYDPCPEGQYWDEDLKACIPFSSSTPSREKVFGNDEMLQYLDKLNRKRNVQEYKDFRNDQLRNYRQENYKGPMKNLDDGTPFPDRDSKEWQDFLNSEEYKKVRDNYPNPEYVPEGQFQFPKDFQTKDYYPKDGEWDEKSKEEYNKLFDETPKEYELERKMLEDYFRENPNMDYKQEQKLLKELKEIRQSLPENQRPKLNIPKEELYKERYDDWCPCYKTQEVIVQGRPVSQKICIPCEQAQYGGSFYKKGGEMIKRADGSYSQRGLWDNIRANSGSGKKPTKEMLAQERKIKRKVDGGITCDEGEEWNEELQACVKVVKESYGKDFLTDWYSKRGNIVNDPNFGGLEESPGYEKWLGKVLPMINNRIQNVPMSYEYLDVPGDNPDAKGVYLYDKKNPTIQIAKSVVANPLDFKTTLLHEYTTDSTADADKFVEPAHKFIVEKNIKSFEDFMDTSPDAEKLKKDEDLQDKMYEEYEYATGQTPEGKGNMHSYVMNWRDAFKMDPSKVYNEDEVAAMVEQAKSAGFFDRNSPAFNDDLYRLYRLAKDNKALANFFNLMANNNAPQKQSRLNDDIQYAKYGGNFGYMPNFF